MSPPDNCPFTTEVQDLYDGILEADRIAPLQAHLSTCASCAREYASVSRLGALLRANDPAPPAPDAARARVLRAALLERSAASLPRAPEPIIRRKAGPPPPRRLFGFLSKAGALAMAVFLYILAAHDLPQRVTPTIPKQVALLPHPVIVLPDPILPHGKPIHPAVEKGAQAAGAPQRKRERDTVTRLVAHTPKHLPAKPTASPSPAPEALERVVIIADAGTTKPEPERQPRPAQSTITIVAQGGSETDPSDSGSFAIVKTTYQETQP